MPVTSLQTYLGPPVGRHQAWVGLQEHQHLLLHLVPRLPGVEHLHQLLQVQEGLGLVAGPVGVGGAGRLHGPAPWLGWVVHLLQGPGGLAGAMGHGAQEEKRRTTSPSDGLVSTEVCTEDTSRSQNEEQRIRDKTGRERIKPLTAFFVLFKAVCLNLSVHPLACVTGHVSPVRCHVSGVRCHVSQYIYIHIYLLFYFLDKAV